MNRKHDTLKRKLDNLKRTKQTRTRQIQTKQNTYNRDLQDRKYTNITKINLNNKATNILEQATNTITKKETYKQ